MWNKEKLRSEVHYLKEKNIFLRCAIIIAIIVIVLAVAFVIMNICKGNFRFDQYATTILGTTAGVIGTMFGLTAASYAFIWGDLRSDGQENQHLGKVLERYSTKIWRLFRGSLILTVVVVLTSLIGLTIVQNITNTSLYKTIYIGRNSVSAYINSRYCWISIVAFLNVVISVIAVFLMAVMNWVVFRRNEQYSEIAQSILTVIKKKYDMKLTDTSHKNISSIEYEKIHNLEILVERILKNHESIGNAFAESQRREKLLTAIITNELEASYGVKDKKEAIDTKGIPDTKGEKDTTGTLDHIQDRIMWQYLEERKRISRWQQCSKNADQEYAMLFGKNEQVSKEKSELPRPCDCSFITVYEDLLSYRDNSLVWEEKHKKKGIRGTGKQVKQEEFVDMFEQRALRYTIKKRLLIFYLRGEAFSNMDFTGASFSGADLRYTNFSDCNLTKIRLKGANCEGADFTRSKMTGMYFADIQANKKDEIGEIQLSCKDVPREDSMEKEGVKEAWDPYKGREITCLQDATFKEADVSRAYLRAPGELEETQVFPFGKANENEWKLGKENVVFSLTGTNFDYAKMFFSYFKNVDFTNSSLEKAQMYNIGMVQTKAKSANFAAVILTNSCFAWCDFENADFSDASLAETILVRVNFSGAYMKNINFAYSNIVACNFEGASCQNASFKNVVQDLDRIKDLSPRALREINLGEEEGLSFRYATLTNTDFSGAELDKVTFSNAVGQDCIFTKVVGKTTIFDSAVFNSSVFNSVKFERSSFQNTSLRNSVLIDSEFINSLFYKTNFSGTLFEGSIAPCFVGGYMDEVDFSNAKGLAASCFSNICLRNVDFRGTGIHKIDFRQNVKIIECKF